MTFKDDLKNDLPTFLNVEEFGELIDINGVLLPAQIMKHSAEKSQRLSQQHGGLHGDFSELFFMTKPYLLKKKKLPVQGQWLWVNGIRYDVISCEDEQGICHIILSAYRQEVPRR